MTRIKVPIPKGGENNLESKFLKAQSGDPERRDYLLKVCLDMLKKMRDSHFVISPFSDFTMRYDDADCDGSCLIDDIESALEE